MDFETCEISFDCVLPSAIFFNDKLEPGAIKLYAMIRNRAKIAGYCFDKTHYLSGLLDVDEKTIKRWMDSLQSEGFIEVDTSKAGFTWDRRIYLSDKFKKCLRRVKNVPSKGQKCPYRGVKNVPSLKEDSKNKEDITPPAPSKGDCVSFGTYVKLSKKEYEESLKLLGSEGALKSMIEDINDHISSTGRKPYKDYAATIRNWVKRRGEISSSKKQDSRFEENIAYGKKITEIFPEQAQKEEIVLKENGLLFVYGNVYKLFEFTDFDFKTKVINRLKSMGLYVS